MILENPSADGPFGAKAIGEMANNAQPPAIAAAIHDAVGVWVTEMPATPERVLKALEEKKEPRRDGKRVVFDEELSMKTVSSDGGEGFYGVPASAWNGRSWDADAVRVDRLRACSAGHLRPGQAGVARADAEQVMILDGPRSMTVEEETRTLKVGDVVVVNRGPAQPQKG